MPSSGLIISFRSSESSYRHDGLSSWLVSKPDQSMDSSSDELVKARQTVNLHRLLQSWACARNAQTVQLSMHACVLIGMGPTRWFSCGHCLGVQKINRDGSLVLVHPPREQRGEGSRCLKTSTNGHHFGRRCLQSSRYSNLPCFNIFLWVAILSTLEHPDVGNSGVFDKWNFQLDIWYTNFGVVVSDRRQLDHPPKMQTLHLVSLHLGHQVLGS